MALFLDDGERDPQHAALEISIQQLASAAACMRQGHPTLEPFASTLVRDTVQILTEAFPPPPPPVAK